jgi:hypothetical protein
MGNITDRPKAPSSQIVYVPQAVYQSGGSDTTGATPQTPSASDQREKNLLSRNRSRLGTILTSFRGILAPSDTDGKRKTLLGE